MAPSPPDPPLSDSAQGVAAALSAPLAMAMAFFLWDGNWKGSSLVLNLFKCGLATVVFIIVGVLSAGPSSWFASATWPTSCWLLLSGFIGIVVGDTASLRSLRLIGAKRYIMIDSLRPFISSLFGWAFLGDALTVGLIAGVTITTAGVLLASLERENAGHKPSSQSEQQQEDGDVREENSPLLEPVSVHLIDVPTEKPRGAAELGVGYFLAALHAVLDVTGSLITRQSGMQYSSMEINTIRFGSSALVLGALTACGSACRLIQRRKGLTCGGGALGMDGIESRWHGTPSMSVKAWGLVACGAVLGTFVCPSLGVFSLFKISFPVYATLSSLAPVYCLPLAWLMHRQRITVLGGVGAILAFLGVVPLYLSA